MRYLVIKPNNGQQTTYKCTETWNGNKLGVKGSYIPIMSYSSSRGLHIKGKKVGDYTTTSSQSYTDYTTDGTSYSGTGGTYTTKTLDHTEQAQLLTHSTYSVVDQGGRQYSVAAASDVPGNWTRSTSYDKGNGLYVTESTLTTHNYSFDSKNNHYVVDEDMYYYGTTDQYNAISYYNEATSTWHEGTTFTTTMTRRSTSSMSTHTFT